MDNMGRNTKIFIHHADVAFYHNNFEVSTNTSATTVRKEYFADTYGTGASFGKLNETSISPFLTKTTNESGGYSIADKILVFQQPCSVSYTAGSRLLATLYG
jgi:hypothetical protein